MITTDLHFPAGMLQSLSLLQFGLDLLAGEIERWCQARQYLLSSYHLMV